MRVSVTEVENITQQYSLQTPREGCITIHQFLKQLQLRHYWNQTENCSKPVLGEWAVL